MHERKARMAELSDAFVALPSGAGTLEELFEVWTWGQLGLHRKPTALFDPDGFYAPLREQLDRMTEAGYLGGSDRESARERLESVGWVHVVDERVLAVRTRGRDRFYLPGGKLEPGEAPADALVREVREELGVALTAVTPAFTVTAPAHGLDTPTDLTMRCYFAAGSGRPNPAREIDEMAWLDVPADRRAAPALSVVLERLG